MIALSVFVVILIIGFLTKSKPLITYEKTMAESVEAIAASEDYVYPWELEEIIANKPDSIVLFDLRNNFAFGQGSIPGSKNLSASVLSRKENIERMKRLRDMGVTVVLVGNDELHANGPWMFFRQVGFDNVKLLLGGYDYYFQHKDDLYSTIDDDAYFKEIARFDYAEMASPAEGVKLNNEPADKQVTVSRREKANIAAGGC